MTAAAFYESELFQLYCCCHDNMYVFFFQQNVDKFKIQDMLVSITHDRNVFRDNDDKIITFWQF